MTGAKVAAAFVAAQRAFGPALKTSQNAAFKSGAKVSRYADLQACVDAVLDALNANGLALMQPTRECDSGALVETLFLHESGEMLSGGVLHVPAAKQDPQGYGSALTYARRYSLMSACGIAPEDDDGNAATNAMQQAPSLDDIVRQIIADAKRDPAAAASKLAISPDDRRDAIWAKLPADVQGVLTDNWPVA